MRPQDHVPLIYLFLVLKTLQNRQVVAPGMFGAKPGQVLPAYRLLCQLPAGRALSKQRGPSYQVLLSASWVHRSRPRTSGWILWVISFSSKFGDNAVFYSNWMHKRQDAHQKQEQRNTYTVRHLHRASQPAAAFKRCWKNWGLGVKLQADFFYYLVR